MLRLVGSCHALKFVILFVLLHWPGIFIALFEGSSNLWINGHALLHARVGLFVAPVIRYTVVSFDFFLTFQAYVIAVSIF